jgi:hypothetical protein
MDLNVIKLKKPIINPIDWKGTWVKGNVPCIITPKTNKDYTNTQPAPFGKPRPLKQPRLGRVVADNNAYKTTNNYYQRILERIMDYPSATIVKSNVNSEYVYEMDNGIEDINNDEIDCYFYSKVPYTVDYNPIKNITQTPIPLTCNPSFCCNEQKKAIRRVVGANTNIKENYYLTTQEYLQRRCLTYDQNSYDFYYKNNKKYVFQCRGNTNGNCKEAYYNPSNQLFPVEGAVTNSSYTNKLKSDTIASDNTDSMKLMYQQPCINGN